MKFRIFLLAVVSLFTGIAEATAQDDNFRARQKKMKAEIEKNYKSKKLSANEYGKLMEEQASITQAIELAEVDGVVTPAEKNKIHAKLTRAGKRLIKYKNNNEIY